MSKKQFSFWGTFEPSACWPSWVQFCCSLIVLFGYWSLVVYILLFCHSKKKKGYIWRCGLSISLL